MKEPYEKPEMATEEIDMGMLVAQAGSPVGPVPYPAAGAGLIGTCDLNNITR